MPVGAQISVPDTTAVVVDFNAYTGAGFASSPTAGQLDSNNMIVSGLSDGDMSWGGDYTTGDYARGQSTGGVTTAGLYGGNNAGDYFFMFQPGGSDMTPGALRIRYSNDTGLTIDSLIFHYTAIQYNDQDRSNTISLYFSEDGSTWSGIGPFNYSSDETASGSPAFDETSFGPYTLPVDIAPGSTFYLEFRTDDSSGSGSRDELGVDDISVQVDSTSPVELLNFTVN